jgi:transposase
VEDRRQPHRERERLMNERIEHTNRIKGLLFAQGIGDYEPQLKSRRKRLEELVTGDGRALPTQLKQQILREIERLELVMDQIKLVEAERDVLIEAAPASAARVPGASLVAFRGIAQERAAVIGGECLWRDFKNRREVGAYAGLPGSPFKSGQIDRDQGMSKAGNKRLRRTMIELAWSWLQHQAGSQLSLWFHRRVGPKPTAKRKKVFIAALARKLLIALWRYDTQGVIPEGAILKTA